MRLPKGLEIRSFRILGSRVMVFAPGAHGEPGWRIHYCDTSNDNWQKIVAANDLDDAFKKAKRLAEKYK